MCKIVKRNIYLMYKNYVNGIKWIIYNKFFFLFYFLNKYLYILIKGNWYLYKKVSLNFL